jgi:carbamoyltransferase
MPRQVARLLSENKIVARCSGRMEFGARALGNRSILANPSDPLNVRRINEAIKNRDFWMPFAPSILEQDMPRYVHHPDRIFALYMCMAFQATPEGQRDLAAAMHPKDLTLRPQAVRRDWNEAFFDILHAFKGLTGVGGVLNTSFNLHGEPMVCSPADAIHTADRCGIDHLVLEDVLLVKRRRSASAAHEDHGHTRAPAYA